MFRNSLGSMVAMTATLILSPVFGQDFRTIDGSDNNVANPAWGSAGIELIRDSSAEYGDGASTPAGASRPSARVISNAVCSQIGSVPNSVLASDYVWQWGQFVDHDIDLTDTHNPATDPLEVFPIPVPLGDPYFDPMGTGTQELFFVRSVDMPGSTPRQQMNFITSWIDASNVYGSDTARADELRTLDGTGRLQTSANDLLPFNVNGFPNAQPGGVDPGLFFLAGDVRANEQVALTAMHTIFMREHNRLADEIALANPALTGDEIYLQARRIVGALMQVITYNEFLPALLGPGALDPYVGYDPSIDPSIRNIFSTGCYRFGHSMLSPNLLRVEENGLPIAEGHLALRDGFFSPFRITDEGGVSPLIRGLARQLSQDVDTRVVDEVRNFLFGPPGAGGFDLAALNIQRGRDHGLPDYNQARIDVGLAPVASFGEMTSNPLLALALESTYGDVNDVDVWVGGLAEDPLPGALVGELVYTVLKRQFEMLRDSDRFWFEIDLTGPELADVSSTTLADVILRNTDIVTIQDNVFVLGAAEFARGNCNQDDMFDLADPIYLLQAIFVNGDPLYCEDACDTNDDGGLDISDVIQSLTAIFLQGEPPAAPYPGCGSDPTDDTLTCVGFVACP